MVAQEEIAVAARHAGGRSPGYRRSGWRSVARVTRGPATVGGSACPQTTAAGPCASPSGRRSGGRGRRSAGVALGGGTGRGHRRAHSPLLRVRCSARVAVPRRRLRRGPASALRPALR